MPPVFCRMFYNVKSAVLTIHSTQRILNYSIHWTILLFSLLIYLKLFFIVFVNDSFDNISILMCQHIGLYFFIVKIDDSI